MNRLLFVYTIFLHDFFHGIEAIDTSVQSVHSRIILSLMVSLMTQITYDQCLTNIYWAYLIGMNYQYHICIDLITHVLI